MTEDTPTALELVSSQDLLDELARRGKASDQHGIIAVMASPVEGKPDHCGGSVTVSSLNAGLIRHLLQVLLRHFRVEAGPHEVRIPEMAIEDGKLHVMGSSVEPLSGWSSTESFHAWLAELPGVFVVPAGRNENGEWHTEFLTILARDSFEQLCLSQGFACIDTGQYYHSQTQIYVSYDTDNYPLPRIRVEPA